MAPLDRDDRERRDLVFLVSRELGLHK